MSPIFEIVTICGSMRHYEQMLVLAQELTGDGYIVLMPFVADYVGDKPSDATKVMLDEMHLAKMGMSNAVYVVGMHRGESTKREIQWAEARSIPVHYRYQEV